MSAQTPDPLGRERILPAFPKPRPSVQKAQSDIISLPRAHPLLAVSQRRSGSELCTPSWGDTQLFQLFQLFCTGQCTNSCASTCVPHWEPGFLSPLAAFRVVIVTVGPVHSPHLTHLKGLRADECLINAFFGNMGAPFHGAIPSLQNSV